MSMKIGKKILAGTLALMNTFTAASAEPVKVEKPTDSFISTKEDKKPNCESTLKELAKGAAITARVTAIAAVGALIGGAIGLARNVNDPELLEVSRRVFEWYLDPKVRKCVEKYKDTKLGKALKYLFDVWDKNRVANAYDFTRSLFYIRDCMKDSRCKFEWCELYNVLNEYDERTGHCTIKCLNPNGDLASSVSNTDNDRLSICIDSTSDFSGYKGDFIQLFSSASNFTYELKAIMLNVRFTNMFSLAYVKQEDGKWHGYPIYYNKLSEKMIVTINDLDIYEQVSCFGKNGRINLVYVKTC